MADAQSPAEPRDRAPPSVCLSSASTSWARVWATRGSPTRASRSPLVVSVLAPEGPAALFSVVGGPGARTSGEAFVAPVPDGLRRAPATRLRGPATAAADAARGRR